jgi:hypothetical protein
MPYQQARLPPELMDTIIKLLRDDRAALATCALVCRSWVPASRHHLFYNVTIGPGNLTDISYLLSSMSCTISSAVEHLALEELDLFRFDVCEVVGKLSHINRLWISGANMVVFPPPTLAPLLCNLETLHLSVVHFVGSGPLCSLSNHCPQLRSLSFSFISLVTAEQPLSSPAGARMPRLTSLALNESPRFFEWFVRNWAGAGSFPQLTKLELDVGVYSGLEAATERLLEAVGQTVQDLSLSELPRIGKTPGEWI